MTMIDSLEDLKNLEEFVGSYSTLIEQTKTLLASFDHDKPKSALSNLVELKKTKQNRILLAENEAKKIEEHTQTTRFKRSECYESIKELREKLNKLKNEREDILREKEKMKLKLKETNDSIHKIQIKPKIDTSEIEKELNMFRNIFGLDLKKKEEGTLTLIFKYIFQLNPDRVCSCDLILENNKYKVKNFRPEIGRTTKLVEILNENNNLGHFILEIRNRFQKLEEK